MWKDSKFIPLFLKLQTENFSPELSLHLQYTYDIPTVYLPYLNAKSKKYYKNPNLQKNILQNLKILEINSQSKQIDKSTNLLITKLFLPLPFDSWPYYTIWWKSKLPILS